MASMLALSSGLAFTQGNVAGDFCKVRALKDMESSYPSGFISLGPSQIFAFSNNWRNEGLQESFDREAKFASGRKIVAQLDSTYGSGKETARLLSLHLSLKTAQIWVMTTDIRSGSMNAMPVDSGGAFAAAAMFFDKIVCTATIATTTIKAKVASADLPSGYRLLQDAQTDPYVLASVRTDLAAKYYDRLNNAKALELDQFKQRAPLDFEKAQRSNQLIRLEMKRNVSSFKFDQSMVDAWGNTADSLGASNVQRLQRQRDLADAIQRAQIRSGSLNKYQVQLPSSGGSK
ncbi:MULTISPECIES: hypothetical protein [Variovorax]|uniref:hypothetical protein n=1 Tax=Variovorax TaxID=34072 RepID=UPI00160F169D|nr:MULTISPECIES: hypothetical protein [unclassified Variovorax]MBB3639658.1 hypothetical protein [Variovorax sp. BK613]MDN6886833.1 hypothetical protein [Variovorax sp. CAN15]